MSDFLVLAQQSSAGGNGFAIAGGATLIIILVIGLLTSIFWIWMLIDVLTSNIPTGEKVLWFLVVFFLHLIGAIIYYVVRRTSRATPTTT